MPLVKIMYHVRKIPMILVVVHLFNYKTMHAIKATFMSVLVAVAMVLQNYKAMACNSQGTMIQMPIKIFQTILYNSTGFP